MEKLVVAGGRPLKGRVTVSGAKNAILKLMAASLLANRRCIIRNVPRLRDVQTMLGVLRALGAEVGWLEEHTIFIDPTTGLGYEPPEELVREMRASIQVMGPLLTRLGKAKMFQPGGCVIGQRPIDLHLKGFQALGAEVAEEHGFVFVKAEELKGAEIHLDFPSVGATENIMAAGIFARGTTVIRNAAREPEIIEQQNFFNHLGARIRGAGTDHIRIEGVDSLNDREIDYTVIPDRIEAGTYMIAAAVTAGDVFIEDMIPEHVEALLAKLHEVGAEIVVGHESVRVRGPVRLEPCDVVIMPYPGFPTDLQPQMVAMLSVAGGTSVVTENVFNGRYRYSDELLRMGASIKVEGRSAIIKGVASLSGAAVRVPDLRGGAALVLAGLVAEGETVLEDIDHIDRGYEPIEKKLESLGACVKRVSGEQEEELQN